MPSPGTAGRLKVVSSFSFLLLAIKKLRFSPPEKNFRLYFSCGLAAFSGAAHSLSSLAGSRLKQLARSRQDSREKSGSGNRKKLCMQDRLHKFSTASTD
jgi:hypothetical protein